MPILHESLKDDGYSLLCQRLMGQEAERQVQQAAERKLISSRRNGEMPLKYTLKDLVLAFCN